MDSELLTCLLKFIEYFPDYLSALSRTLLRCFGQPLSKQLYTQNVNHTTRLRFYEEETSYMLGREAHA